MIKLGRLGFLDKAQLYDVLVHLVASIENQSWVLPINMISMMLSTLQVM